jgi:hypothetical protein
MCPSWAVPSYQRRACGGCGGGRAQEYDGAGAEAVRAAQRQLALFRDGYQATLRAAHNTYARDRKRLRDVAVRVTQVRAPGAVSLGA